MPFSTSPVIGVNMNDTVLAAAPASEVPHKVGTQAWGDDGKLYVFAKANATIAANTAVAAIGAAPTFLATATGGTYTSPAKSMATGDFGWFGKASV